MRHKTLLMRAAINLLCLGFGAMFLFSSLPKLRQPYDFLDNIYEYGIFGPNVGEFTAVTIPWLEFILGVCFLSHLMLLGAFAIAAALMTVFSALHAYAIYTGMEISCGCFNPSSQELISYFTLTRNLVLLVLCLCGTLLVASRNHDLTKLIPRLRGTEKSDRLSCQASVRESKKR